MGRIWGGSAFTTQTPEDFREGLLAAPLDPCFPLMQIGLFAQTTRVCLMVCSALPRVADQFFKL